MTNSTGSNDAYRISVIIPTLNEENQISDLLNALKERESTGSYIHEIIVADAGSSDGTVTLAEKTGARVVHCSEKSRARQMNRGAEEASGNILYFLHADTFPPDAFDRSIVQAIKNGAGSGCFQLRFSNDHPLLRFYGWFTRFKSTLVRFGDQSLFVKSEIFRQIGGFDENMVVMEDQKIVGNLKKRTSFKLLDRAVTTSARTYEKNGVIRLQFIFSMIVILYYSGAKQDTLVHLYNSLIDL